MKGKRIMKNVHVFSAVLPVIAVLEEKIQEAKGMMFTPLLENQEAKLGFFADAPIQKLDNGYKINFIYSWKKLPRKLIREEAANRVEALLESNPGMIGNEEAIKIKTEETCGAVLAEYCGKVLPETVKFSAYYHEKHEKLIIDAKEEFAQRALIMVCDLLGSIETTTLHCSGISNSLTTNLLSSLHSDEARLHGLQFAGFELGDLLVLSNEHKDIARFKGDYPLDNIQELLEGGYQVKQVNLAKNGLSFTLTEKFKIKQIKVSFEVDDIEMNKGQDALNLHCDAVELEILVSHCNTLRDFFDKQNEGNQEPLKAA